eukprot:3188608-Pyramimonas_sp.AAC.1
MSDQGGALVKGAFKAYHRQLTNWWPDTLLIRYDELSKGANDDDRRECLVMYLQNPASGGFPRGTPSEFVGTVATEDGPAPAKVRRVADASSAGGNPQSPCATCAAPAGAAPMQATPMMATPMQAFTPQRSPAVMLATSVRSTGTPRIKSRALRESM